jgi:hypothetical protein
MKIKFLKRKERGREERREERGEGRRRREIRRRFLCLKAYGV